MIVVDMKIVPKVWFPLTLFCMLAVHSYASDSESDKSMVEAASNSAPNTASNITAESAPIESTTPSSVVLDSVWARATAPGMPMGAIYAEVKNLGFSKVRLVSIETPAARMAEVHESIEISGMMRMREITPFEIAPRGSVSLVPGGKHIMLMGLKGALKEGEQIPIVLQFSDGSTVRSNATIGGFGQMSMP